MKMLFLYTELSDYFLSCLRALYEVSNSEIQVVHFKINKEAPFIFEFSDKIIMHERATYNKNKLLNLANQISPDIIYCSGWTDPGYLAVCKAYKDKIPVIVGFDNKWKGTFKQRLASAFRGISINTYFSHCWIPGRPQYEFANRLGFRGEKILTGFYTCDFDFYYNMFLKYREIKNNKYPHRFIFVGRYVAVKGVTDLWEAFIQLQNESPCDWELWCLGIGDLLPIAHPKIKHFGFVQPKDIEKFIAETGVFILPSIFEPWGVAVHEFASAGFPLLCSTEVGAADAFLREGENGFVFEAGNVQEIKRAMKKIISLNDEELFNMGQKSIDHARNVTPTKWVDTILSILNSDVKK